MKCRHCGSPVHLPFLDLGSAPPSNSYLTADAMRLPEKWFPLKVLVCEGCWLVQTEDYAHFADLFSADYAYFSSFSSSWLQHAENYVEQMINRYGLDEKSNVVEVAANDGYLLQFVRQRGVPCLGVEPTASTAKAARDKGIPIVEEFFGVGLAKKLVQDGHSADLTVANNVLAHVPDIDDFVAGFAELLKPSGISTFEFPHLLKQVQENQFDTVYHEHFSYLSLTAVQRIFEKNGLTVTDVEELSTHGGSLRVHAQRQDCPNLQVSPRVDAMCAHERACGVSTREFYLAFQEKAIKVKNDLLLFLLDAKRNGKRVAAYGAAAKGNTLLNYAGVKSDLVEFVVDRNPAKQGKWLPGSRIPVVAESALAVSKPDFIPILPWNLKAEVVEQLSYARGFGARFVSAVPTLQIL